MSSSRGNKPSVVGTKSKIISESQVGNKGKRRRSSDGQECPAKKKPHCVQETKVRAKVTRARTQAQTRISRIRKGESTLRSAVYTNKSSSQPPCEDLTQVNLKSVKKFVPNPLGNVATKKDIVILKSPEASSCSLREKNSNKHTTPLKKLYCTEISSGQGIGAKSTSTEVLTPGSSLEYSCITISEASDSASSSKNYTPATQRLIKIRKSYSSSDKTFTPPGFPNKPLNRPCFKLLTRSPTSDCGLEVPLNRNLFNNRIQPANDRSTTDEAPEKHIQVKAGHCDNIVDAQVKSNKFRSNNANAEIEPSFDIPNISPRSVFDNNNVTHRLIHHSEPVKTEISVSEIFPPSGAHSPKKSATDRINRIKNEGCNTYKKNEQRVLHNTGTENLVFSQPTEAQQENICFENPKVGIVDLQGLLQSPDSPNNRQTFAKEDLTSEWLSDHTRGMRAENPRLSDSLVVNLDDTLLNKSELLDPIEDVSMDWDSIPQPNDAEYFSHPAPVPAKPEKENLICVVTDTNVFIHFLHRVRETVNLELPGSQQAKIYVPWMVLKELDHLKDRCGQPLRSFALDAEKYINHCVGLPDAKILGQTVQEASDQQDIGMSPDDKILSCCLQALNKYDTVILLSNDINLRNKAIINNIVACTPQEIISTLKSMKFCKTRRDLVVLWSKIIGECCEQAYGIAWQKMEPLKTFTLLECMKRYSYYIYCTIRH